MTVYHGGHVLNYNTGKSVPAPQPHPVSRGVVLALAAYAAMATWAVYEGLRAGAYHSSTPQLNLSASCGIGGAARGYVGVV